MAGPSSLLPTTPFARRLCLIALAGLALRLLYVLLVTRGAALTGDAGYYHEAATSSPTGWASPSRTGTCTAEPRSTSSSTTPPSSPRPPTPPSPSDMSSPPQATPRSGC